MARLYRIFLVLAFFLIPSLALADGISIEGALTLAPNFPTGTAADFAYVEGGFFGNVSYEFPHWGLGVRSFGAFSHDTSIDFNAGGLALNGTLARRQYGVAAFVRRFFTDAIHRKRWYFELSFMAMQTDFISAEHVYVLPQSPGYTRIFIQGGAFSIGVGLRPKRGPWFYQLTYRLEHYDTLLVTGNVNYLHPVFIQAPLSPIYFVHNIQFSVGLDIFGR